jgi:heptosyltransferase II
MRSVLPAELMSAQSPEILVIRLSSLGDVILSSAVLRAIAQATPNVKLTFATKIAYQPLFEHFDVPITVAAFSPGQSLLSYRRLLSGTRYDCIIDLHGSVRSVILSRLLRARRRVRVKKYVARRKAMVRSKDGLDRPLSATQAYLDTLKSIGMSVGESMPKLCLSVEEARQVESLRTANPSSIGIGWGARWPTKVVPPTLWHAILEKLDGDCFNNVSLFGLDSDRSEMEAFSQAMRAARPTRRIQIECGRPLREVMVKTAACSVFVSSDSGLMHLATALGVPSFGLFGPTHPALGFGPVGPKDRAFHAGTWCSPCHRHGAAPCFRERRFCFDDLKVDDIADEITGTITRAACGSGNRG